MRPRLIVNGDDFGRTASGTRAIVEAYERGILTSTSLVASGLQFDLAVESARRQPELGVGVHLVVDENDPVADPREIPDLLGADGRFHSRSSSLLGIASGRIPRAQVAREWQAQIAKVVDAGLKPTHLDGHGHCHAHPMLASIVADLAQKFDIPAARLPAEPLAHGGPGGGRSLRRYLEKLLLAGACRWPRSRWRGRLHTPDSFFGFTEGGRLSPQALESIARSLRAGVAELMSHPALDNEDPPYALDYDWRGDFEALTAWGKHEFEDRFGVELVSYRDAWSRP